MLRSILVSECMQAYPRNTSDAAKAVLALENDEKKQTMVFEGEKVVFYSLRKGEKIPWENHSDETQVIHIVQGELAVHVTGPKAVLKGGTGDTIYVNRGKKHMVEAMESTVAWSEYIS